MIVLDVYFPSSFLRIATDLEELVCGSGRV